MTTQTLFYVNHLLPLIVKYAALHCLKCYPSARFNLQSIAERTPIYHTPHTGRGGAGRGVGAGESGGSVPVTPPDPQSRPCRTRFPLMTSRYCGGEATGATTGKQVTRVEPGPAQHFGGLALRGWRVT